MICGTVQIEDLTIHFRMESGCNVHVNVQNGLDGETGFVKCGFRQFAASMAIALDRDAFGECSASMELYEEAQAIKFPSDTLRWIP